MSQPMGLSESDSDDILGAINMFGSSSEPKGDVDKAKSEFICEVSGKVVPEGEQAAQGRMGFKTFSQSALNAPIALPWKLLGMP